MTSRLRQSDLDLISRYIDGDLTPEEMESFERRCLTDHSLKRELDEWRRLKSLVEKRVHIPANPAFWTKLSTTLDERRNEDSNLLPFPRRTVPIVLGAAALLVAALGFAIMQSGYPILRFWERQSEVVRQAVNSGVMQGSLLPLLAGLDSDRTLQFALYGTLPLDDEKGTTLKVDERSREGYRIEVQKEVPRKQKKVTVSEFLAEVRPSTTQRAAIDSLLIVARRELEGSVLVGANREMAINPHLHQLNKTMVSGLAACLEPEQRVRLNRLLTEREAPYVVVTQSTSAIEPSKVMESIRTSLPQREFVVLRNDTVELSRMMVNLDKFRVEMDRNQEMVAELAARRSRLFDEWSSREEAVHFSTPANVPRPHVFVRTQHGRLTIDVSDSMSGTMKYFDISVTPRLRFDEKESAPGVLEIDAYVPQPRGSSSRSRVVVSPQGIRIRVATPDTVVHPRRPLPVVID